MVTKNYAQLVTFKPPRIELDYGCYRQQLTFNGGEYSNIMRQVLKIHDKKVYKAIKSYGGVNGISNN